MNQATDVDNDIFCSGIKEGCASGCASSPCQHHGLCLEDTKLSGRFTCDCIGTGYAANYCDKGKLIFLKAFASCLFHLAVFLY